MSNPLLGSCDDCKKTIEREDSKIELRQALPCNSGSLWVRKGKIIGTYHTKCFFKKFKGRLRNEIKK